MIFKKYFDSRNNLHTTLIVSRTSVTIYAIRLYPLLYHITNLLNLSRDQLLSTLRLVELREHNRKELKCLASTRLTVIKSIIEWFADESDNRKKSGNQK